MTQLSIDTETIAPYEVHLVCCKVDESRTLCDLDSAHMLPAREPDGPYDLSCLACLAGLHTTRCPKGGECTG